MNKIIKNSFVTIFIVSLLGYIGILSYFYFNQKNLLFKPKKLPDNHVFSYPFRVEEIDLMTPDNVRINSIYSKADSTKGYVIFYHGNALNAQGNPQRLGIFLENGFDVIMPDYRGFGKSGGSIKSEEQFYADAQLVYDYMKSNHSEDSLYVVGYSMGTGLATYIAANNNPKSLVLWAPYFSMESVLKHYYPFLPAFILDFPLRTDLWFPKVKSPVTVFHGTEDRVLPFSESEKLSSIFKSSDTLIVLSGEQHGFLFRNEILRSNIKSAILRGSAE